jgi:DNA (cytosine-5)-methyltransferase 1
VLENVKGLLSHDNGRTYKIIIAALAELGYSVTWQVLDSQDFGAAQRRERVIIVGYLGARCPFEIFPICTQKSAH